MAQREVVIFLDSLTGEEVEQSDVSQVVVSVGNDAWKLDLTDDSLGKLYEALEPFTKNEAKLPRGAVSAPAAGKARASAAPAFTPEEREAIAAFADANGLPPVSERGRIRKATVDAWVEAGKPSVGDSKASATKKAPEKKPAEKKPAEKKDAPAAEFTDTE